MTVIPISNFIIINTILHTSYACTYLHNLHFLLCTVVVLYIYRIVVFYYVNCCLFTCKWSCCV